MRQLTIREINSLTRDGGNGRNVYLLGSDALGRSRVMRVTRARTRSGKVQVYTLTTGEWITVSPAHSMEVR